jgi:signal transduction histidine kinase
MKTSFKNAIRLVGIFHFWIIVLMIIILTIMYYGRYLQIADGFPWFDPIRNSEIAYSVHGSLFTVPFIYAAAVFGYKGAIAVWIISLSIIMPLIKYLSIGHTTLVRNILASLIPLMIVILITVQLKIREREKSFHAQREKERKIYFSQALKAQEDERRRIAQELHDDCLQSLVITASMAEKILSHGVNNPGLVLSESQNIKSEAIRLSEDIRRLCLDLRPTILDNSGFIAALGWLIDRFYRNPVLK